MASNRKIDALITQGQFLIDTDRGITLVMKYLNDLELIQAGGVTVKDLGYNNSAEARISVITPTGRITNRTTGQPGSIAKVSLHGVMTMGDGLCAPGMVAMAEQIQDLDADPSIAGFKFDVNSPGGEATAGIHLYNTIKDLKKPSVAQVHLMASAAYLALLPVNEVVALSSLSEIGSIGAMVTVDKDFLEWFKTTREEIYSSKSPDKNEEMRAYLAGDSSKIVKKLDGLVDEFHAKVVMHRELNPDYKKETLGGRIFMAKDAKTRGLIDSIGTESFATKRLQNYINQKLK